MIKLVAIIIGMLLMTTLSASVFATSLEEFQNCHCHNPDEWFFTDYQSACQNATSLEQVRAAVSLAKDQCYKTEFEKMGAAGMALSMTCGRHYKRLEKAMQDFEAGDPTTRMCAEPPGAPLS